MEAVQQSNFHWYCKHTWKRSAKNTMWCLIGCSIGDFGTILFFQLTQIPWPVLVSLGFSTSKIVVPDTSTSNPFT